MFFAHSCWRQSTDSRLTFDHLLIVFDTCWMVLVPEILGRHWENDLTDPVTMDFVHLGDSPRDSQWQ